jgi:hypothetical protein
VRRVALLAMVVSQAAMVGVMTMTPVHMRCTATSQLSHYVISLHIAGMFAFSPLVGPLRRPDGAASARSWSAR